MTPPIPVDDPGDLVVEANNGPTGLLAHIADLNLGSLIDTVISSIDYTLGTFVESFRDWRRWGVFRLATSFMPQVWLVSSATTCIWVRAVG